MWDEIGRLQLEFMLRWGTEPKHSLLDDGCGSLCGGVHFVRYLDPGKYYGVDIDPALIEAGYKKEIVPLGLADKLPRRNLICSEVFDATVFGRRFDFALAVSVLTHINWSRIRLCLDRLTEVMQPGGVFFATYFDLPEGARASAALPHPPARVTTLGHWDPFHYRVSDFRQAAQAMPWSVESIGE